MFCRNCMAELGTGAAVCLQCGVGAGNGNKYCPSCAGPTDPAAEICIKCGVRVNTVGGEQRSKIAAGMMAILVGSLGIHRFYLGFNGIGFIQLFLGLFGGFVTCGVSTMAVHLWGIIEGILILTGSIDKDASGRPLKD